MRQGVLVAAFAASLAIGTALAALPTAFCGDCKVEHFATCTGFLEGATIDSKGALWVVDLLSGKVLTVGDDGKCTVRGNTGGQPNGAKFGPDGKLWIADKQLGLLRMDPDSGMVTPVAVNFRNERLRGLNDLAFDAAGGVYFTEPYGSSALKPDGRLFYLPPGANAKLQLVSGGLAFPNGVLVSRSGGNVLVGEYALKRITSLATVTATDDFDIAHVYATTQGGIGPDGMTMTRDGLLIAANFNAGEVLAFDATGHALGTIPLPGGPMVTNVAIRDGWLYVTEGSRGEVWRVRIAPPTSTGRKGE